MHAGKAYADYGLKDGLHQAGAKVHRPLAHMAGIGAQCAWYAERLRDMPDTTGLAELIADDFYNDRFDLSARGMASHTGWSLMPAVEVTQKLRGLGASDRAIRVFFTLVSAMNRARDATQLWRAAAQLFESHPEVFDPACVRSMAAEELSELLFQSRVSRRHRPDVAAWRDIAGSLVSGVGAVSRLVDSGAGDAEDLLKDLRHRDSGGRARYPLLKGPKIRAMWVRIMANHGGAAIQRMETIPVAVDVHVRRVTENLGVTDTRDLELEDARPVIQDAWRTAVRAARVGGPARIAGTCAALDPALWFFGKHGCSHCQQTRVPISRACENCRLPPTVP